MKPSEHKPEQGVEVFQDNETRQRYIDSIIDADDTEDRAAALAQLLIALKDAFVSNSDPEVASNIVQFELLLLLDTTFRETKTYRQSLEMFSSPYDLNLGDGVKFEDEIRRLYDRAFPEQSPPQGVKRRQHQGKT